MSRLLLLSSVAIALLACAEPSDDDGVIDREHCIFELELWCHDSEMAGGPAPGEHEPCPETRLAEAIASVQSRSPWRHIRCDAGELGELDVVASAGGHWYFDTDDELVARIYYTDYPAYCDGDTSESAYGARPECTNECFVEGSEPPTDLPICP